MTPPVHDPTSSAWVSSPTLWIRSAWATRSIAPVTSWVGSWSTVRNSRDTRNLQVRSASNKCRGRIVAPHPSYRRTGFKPDSNQIPTKRRLFCAILVVEGAYSLRCSRSAPNRSEGLSVEELFVSLRAPAAAYRTINNTLRSDKQQGSTCDYQL